VARGGFFGFIDGPTGPEDEDDVAAVDPLDGIRPSAWIAGVVPLELVVARSDDGAIVVEGIRAFPDGWQMILRTIRRSSPRPRPRRRPPGVVHAGRAMFEADDRDDEVKIGMQWPDGGRALVDEGWDLAADATAPSHVLESGGGQGGDREYTHELWAQPIPESGDVVLVCEWAAMGIPETHVHLDGEALRAGAARARPVWETDQGRSFVSRTEMINELRRRHAPDDPTGSAPP
jgi:hypothetical protein